MVNSNMTGHNYICTSIINCPILKMYSQSYKAFFMQIFGLTSIILKSDTESRG